MVENWYFLVGNDNPDLDRIRIECATQHGRNTLDNELSETIGFFCEERLIKVAGGNGEWQNARDWIPSLLVSPMLQGFESDDELRLKWYNAQDPYFDSNNDGIPDTKQQRKNYWNPQ